jgi:hypothetical protein
MTSVVRALLGLHAMLSLIAVCSGVSVYVNPLSSNSSIPCGAAEDIASACPSLANAVKSIPFVTSTSGSLVDILLTPPPSPGYYTVCNLSFAALIGNTTVRNITIKPVNSSVGQITLACLTPNYPRILFYDILDMSLTLDSLVFRANATNMNAVEFYYTSVSSTKSTFNYFNCIVTSNTSSGYSLQMPDNLAGYFYINFVNSTFTGQSRSVWISEGGSTIWVRIINCVTYNLPTGFLFLGGGQKQLLVDNSSFINVGQGLCLRPVTKTVVQNSVFACTIETVNVYFCEVLFNNSVFNGIQWTMWYAYTVVIYNSVIQPPWLSNGVFAVFGSGNSWYIQNTTFQNISTGYAAASALFMVDIPRNLSFVGCTFVMTSLQTPLFGMNRAESTPLTVKFQGCTFMSNFMWTVSPLYLAFTGFSTSSISLSNCIFTGMQSSTNLISISTIWSILISNCTFKDIQMSIGSVITVSSTRSMVQVLNSNFWNVSGTFNVILYTYVAVPTLIRGCNFKDISVSGRYAIYAARNASLLIQNCNFASYHATSVLGPAIFISTYGNMSITNTAMDSFWGSLMIYQQAESKVAAQNITLSNSYDGTCWKTESNSIAVISNSSFSRCRSNNGSALYMDTSSSLTLTNSTFQGNSVSLSGGAIYLALRTSAVLQQCSFIANNAGQHGGAVFVDSGSTLAIQASIFRDNVAVGSGGGCFISSSTSWSFSGVQFINNSAARGGGLYVYEVPPLNSSQVVFSVNMATTSDKIDCSETKGAGGGAFIENSNLSTVPAYFTSWNFTNNLAKSYGGGLAFGSMSTVVNWSPKSLENFTFAGNNASYGSDIGTLWSQVSITLLSSLLVFSQEQLALEFIFIDALNQTAVGTSCSFSSSIVWSNPANYFVMDTAQGSIPQRNPGYQFSTKPVFYRAFPSLPLANLTVNLTWQFSMLSSPVIAKYFNVSVTLCRPGYFLAADPASYYSCQPCYPGTFLSYDQTDYAVCQECPAGKTSFYNSTVCVNCSAGTFAWGTGSQQCTPCTDGSFTSVEGKTVCTACPVSTITLQQRSTSCTSCPTTSSTLNPGGSSPYSCVCPSGTYGEPWSGQTCKTCRFTKGAACKLNSSIPLVLEGFWRDPSIPDVIYQCVPSSACVQTTGYQTPCANGYTGLRCGQCLYPEYFHFDTRCKRCGDMTVSVGGLVGMILIFLFISFSFVTNRTRRTSLDASVVLYSIQLIALYPRLISSWPARMSFVLDAMSITVIFLLWLNLHFPYHVLES